VDPDSNLEEQRDIAREINAIRDAMTDDGATTEQLEALEHRAFRLAELVEALNTWICRGGALPLGWVKGIKRTAR
jgi:hypothetical protein